jgi:hypothetical protein
MAWEVLHAEIGADCRGQGIATMLYGQIAAFLDTKLWPSGWLSDDGYRFRQMQLVTLKAVAEGKLMSG